MFRHQDNPRIVQAILELRAQRSRFAQTILGLSEFEVLHIA